jgi:sulfatase modifying factor 1
MRVPSLIAATAVWLMIGSPAPAVTMAWTPIGNPGNACDPQSQGCFGAVGYSYSIGTFEVTNAQYVEFLNAKAITDPLGLYDPYMGIFQGGSGGSITRSGSDGSYTYSATAGRENMPVNYVSFYDALRFANWMNNGQGNGDTETGAYTLLGPYTTSYPYLGATPSNGTTITRNAGASIVLTSEDEWYKAAYYSAASTSYFDYPTGSDTQPTCAAPSATANRANCHGVVGDFTIVGSYAGSASPYGTFDQAGNAWEWNEAKLQDLRGIRGGSVAEPTYLPDYLAASVRTNEYALGEGITVGFRIAMIPEPSTGLLVIAGLVGLASWRRQSA